MKSSFVLAGCSAEDVLQIGSCSLPVPWIVYPQMQNFLLAKGHSGKLMLLHPDIHPSERTTYMGLGHVYSSKSL